LSFFSNAVVGGHRTELSQTLPHVQKWARYGHECPTYGVTTLFFLTQGPKTACFRVVSRRHRDFSANICRRNWTTDTQKRDHLWLL